MTGSKSLGRPATTSLHSWLDSLREPNLEPYSGPAQIDALAFRNRDRIRSLLADPAVQDDIERAYTRWTEPSDAAQGMQIIKSMLVDACWISHALQLYGQTFAASDTGVPPATRTERQRELMAASKKATQLARTIGDLKPAIGRGLTWPYLRTRLLRGNPPGFIANRKGWGSAIASKEPSVSELLATLATDLKEEANLLKNATAKTRQRGGSKRRYYPLIDTLCRASESLGVVDHENKPYPDFQLVYVILKSISPDDTLDESTLRRRWVRQGRPTSKSP